MSDAMMRSDEDPLPRSEQDRNEDQAGQGEVKGVLFPDEEMARKFIELVNQQVLPAEEIHIAIKDTEAERSFARKTGTRVMANGAIDSVSRYLKAADVEFVPQGRITQMENKFNQGGVLVDLSRIHIDVNEFRHVTTLTGELYGDPIIKPGH